mmetsp:Transcript_7861/g.21082  ORF Transcript_7861/g.21082 Transcript_7861/m.21082 type:complete len:303 (+) Transcript_7861:1085-1993(+)
MVDHFWENWKCARRLMRTPAAIGRINIQKFNTPVIRVYGKLLIMSWICSSVRAPRSTSSWMRLYFRRRWTSVTDNTVAKATARLMTTSSAVAICRICTALRVSMLCFCQAFRTKLRAIGLVSPSTTSDRMPQNMADRWLVTSSGEAVSGSTTQQRCWKARILCFTESKMLTTSPRLSTAEGSMPEVSNSRSTCLRSLLGDRACSRCSTVARGPTRPPSPSSRKGATRRRSPARALLMMPISVANCLATFGVLSRIRNGRADCMSCISLRFDLVCPPMKMCPVGASPSRSTGTDCQSKRYGVL